MPPKTMKQNQEISQKEKSPKNKTKRCPKGEHRNPKTGLCEKRQIKENIRNPPINLKKISVKDQKIFEKRKSCIQKYRTKLPSLKEGIIFQGEEQEQEQEQQKQEQQKQEQQKPSPKKLTPNSKSSPKNTKSPSSKISIMQFHSKSKLLPKSSPFTPTAMRDLSNFSKHDVEYEGKIYPTVEHAFQAQKGGCLVDKKGTPLSEEKKTEFIEKIRGLETAEQAKSAGGKGTMKKEGIFLDIKCWDSKRNNIMEELIKSKVERHEDIRTILRIAKENNIQLVHFSRMDMDWGAHVDPTTGEIKEGENKLGKLYMSLL